MEGRKISDSRGLDENSGFAVDSALFRHIWRAESGFCSNSINILQRQTKLSLLERSRPECETW